MTYNKELATLLGYSQPYQHLLKQEALMRLCATQVQYQILDRAKYAQENKPLHHRDQIATE